MTEIKVQVDSKKAIALLKVIKKRANDVKPVLWKAKEWLGDANSQNFLLAGLPSGGWSPLDPQYASWKSARHPAAGLMIKTGRLFNSLSSLSGPPNLVESMSATFGTKVEYAKFHQYGTSKMAQRKVVYEPVGFSKRLGEVMGAYVADGNTKALRESVL